MNADTSQRMRKYLLEIRNLSHKAANVAYTNEGASVLLLFIRGRQAFNSGERVPQEHTRLHFLYNHATHKADPFVISLRSLS